ncbi:MAG: response regulator transcription factor [Hyphomicrobiales bacterium]|nr:MAG: response regulator transcription factor [Hyphomicrobiales bacterium]
MASEGTRLPCGPTEASLAEHIYHHAFLNRDRLVHIVDPDPTACEALSVLFRLEGYQTAFAIDTLSFFAAIERRRPEVAVINFAVGGNEGLAAMRRVKSMRTGMPIFMIGDAPDIDLVVTAMKAGAVDVLTKPIDTDHLLAAVRDALRHDVHLASLENGRRLIEVRGFDQLTPREREVLQLITNGQSNKEAGRELGISPRTIEVHRARVMEKLGARNTADLMRIVLMGDA